MNAAHIDFGQAGSQVLHAPGIDQPDAECGAGRFQFHVHQWQAYAQVLHDHAHQAPRIFLAQHGEPEQAVAGQVQLLAKFERRAFVGHQPIRLAQQIHDLMHGQAGVRIVEHIVGDAGIGKNGMSLYAAMLHEADKPAGITGRDDRHFQCKFR